MLAEGNPRFVVLVHLGVADQLIEHADIDALQALALIEAPVLIANLEELATIEADCVCDQVGSRTCAFIGELQIESGIPGWHRAIRKQA